MKNNFFNLSDNEIVNLCGEFPENFIEIDIASNPDFVFENDLGYDAVKLFDVEENSVFVNSFVECHHYVNGGWNFIPSQRDESDFHDILIGFSLIIIILANFVIKKTQISRNK